MNKPCARPIVTVNPKNVGIFSVAHKKNDEFGEYYFVKKSSHPYCIVDADGIFWDVEHTYKKDVTNDTKEAILHLIRMLAT